MFVTHPKDFDIIRDEIKRYEIATGARLNPSKSHALAIGTWSHPPVSLGIYFKTQLIILGINFGISTRESTLVSWTTTIRKVRAQARSAYGRFQYVQLCLLAKIWYLAQVLPPTRQHMQQLSTVCAWYIWQGATFRVPMATLHRTKAHGGWAMTDIDAKCRYLLFLRIRSMCEKDCALTITLLRGWDIRAIQHNPSNLRGLPSTLQHVCQYVMDLA